jgi:hypothetical protein
MCCGAYTLPSDKSKLRALRGHADAALRRRIATCPPPRHIQHFLVGRQSNQNRPYVNTDRCLVRVVGGSSRLGLATLRQPRSHSRRIGSAPSKAAKDEPIRPPPPVGGDYALLPRGLALLANHRPRRAFCPCGDECGARGSRSGCLRSFAGRKLPTDASGGSTGDG